jgi:MFS family permease
MLATACVAQVLSVRGAIAPGPAQPLGLVALIAGIAALLVAVPAHSLVLVVAAALLAGTGLGLAYFGGQTAVNELAPPARRGEVTAAFITCVYLAVSVVAISTGLLGDATSLTTAVAIVGVAVAAAAAAVLAWHLSPRAG